MPWRLRTEKPHPQPVEVLENLTCGAMTEPGLVPTAAMARNARKGLRLREEHGRGGTSVGVARARQLISRKPLSESVVRRMVSYFARHAVDRNAPGFGDQADTSAGYIAWLLWGGDEGRRWSMARKKELAEG
jgi:hypothetical protein